MEQLKNSWRNIRNWATPIRCVGLVILVGGVIGVCVSYPAVHPDGFHLVTFLTDFYANASTELVSIAITVLLLDTLNENRAKRERKRAIIEQFGSHSNDFALEAMRILRLEGWLKDGSLRGAILIEANLKKTILRGADLQKAWLVRANLQGADLMGANLQGAILIGANLTGAHLQRANLMGANLQRAQLLGRIYFDKTTTLPDGTKWTPDIDMGRFTDPEHPDSWRSDNLHSPAYRGDESQPQEEPANPEK